MQLSALAQSLHPRGIAWLHLVHDSIDVSIGWYIFLFLIIVEHGIYIFRGEAQHLIELFLSRDMPSDIEATSHII